MLFEVTMSIHVDPDRWLYLAHLDSEAEVPDDVVDFLTDQLNTAFESRDQQGLLDISYEIL